MRTMLWLGAALAALSGCAEARQMVLPSGGTVASVRPGAQMCQYRSEEILGARKVCTYDCGGSQVATTLLGSETCPTTAAYP